MNKVLLVGNLTRDPERSETPNGIPYCKFGIAVNRTYANAQGERETDFFNIITWRNQADSCYKCLHKGSKVGISGSINVRTYDAQDGTKRTSVDISADEVEFLSPRSAGSPDGDVAPREATRDVEKAPSRRPMKESAPVDNEDLPF